MGNRFYNDFSDSQLTGLTTVNSEGAVPVCVSSFNPGQGSGSTGPVVKFAGTETAFSNNGLYTTTSLGSCDGNIIWFFWAITGSTASAIISLEASPKLWTTNTGIVSLHYDQSGPWVKSYSGNNLIVQDNLNGDEYIAHGLWVKPDGSIKFLHAHNQGQGTTLNAWPTAPFWSTALGQSTAADHMNYATAPAVNLAVTFFGGAADTGHLAQLFWTTDGIYVRPPKNLAAIATGQTTTTVTWTDPLVWA